MSCISMSGACEFKPYQPEQQNDNNAEEPENKKLEIIRLTGMATIIVLIAWIHLLQPTWLGNIVVVIAVLAGGYPIFKESFFALRKGRINMELSMAIAIIASLVLYQYLPAIVITFFALLSEFVEGFIVQKGRKNIQLLYDLAPRKAIIKTNNYQNGDEANLTATTLEVQIDAVRVGDVVIVREGDTIPVDGHILRGTSTVNQSSITGESAPIEKSVADSVFAGTTNLTHQIEIKCDKLSTDTTFAKIVHLVEEAEASKAPIQKLSDKLATRLIQFAIGLSVLTFIVTHNVVSTLSVIVVAGACGLAVGTPIALLATNGKLSKRGVIVKGGLQIENLSSAGTIVFDKTGTLTTGKPAVSEVVSFDPRIDPIRILEYAAIAEKNVNHPLAQAIVSKAQEKQIEVNMDNSDNQSRILGSTDDGNNENIIKVGRGVAIFHKGRRIAVGNMKFMEDETKLTSSNTGANTSAALRPGFSLLLNRRQHQYLTKTHLVGQTLQEFSPVDMLFSSTTAFVSLDRQIIGAVLLEDKLRQETKDAIARIKAMSIHVVMLTGDNERTANKIANEAGIEEYHADLLPEDKVSIIEKIVRKQRKGERKKKQEAVIMVGDGINDAPALAKADVGIAMGRSGTDVAIETADVVLMTEDLTKIPYLLKTSRQSLFAIKQNFFGTLFVDGLGFILAFVGLINPLLAAIIHVSSELVFMTNSARLMIDRNGGQTKL
jgi:heavy metal translocating P-type ATPase